jgi:acyl-coenzyme A thioesterase PaaI-like protein
VTAERLDHHELCFGCGRTNLFGLLMDVERTGDGEVRGRGFVKQDHQGAIPGTAHDGIVMAALSEAMAFAAGREVRATAVEIEFEQPVPVGTFVEVEASAAASSAGDAVNATATATAEGRQVAVASGTYRRA